MRDFPQPTNVDDALQRRRTVADDITQIQSRLKDKAPLTEDGRVLTDPRERNDFRQGLKHLLSERYAEARFLKDWLRLNASGKPSEWDLLGRAYRILSVLEEQGVQLGDEAESLLDELELHVPRAHLLGG